MFLSYRGFLSKDTTLYLTTFLEPLDIKRGISFTNEDEALRILNTVDRR